MRPIRCPKCRGSSDDGFIATVDTLIAEAEIGGLNADGTFEYTGNTEVDWNSQETIRNKASQPKLSCAKCGHEWFSRKTKSPR